MTAKLEKGGATFQGIKLLLCENPLPPLDDAIEAARDELARSNYYTEPYCEPLCRLVALQLGVSQRLIHINTGPMAQKREAKAEAALTRTKRIIQVG